MYPCAGPISVCWVRGFIASKKNAYKQFEPKTLRFVFDVWNPMSVDVAAGGFAMMEPANFVYNCEEAEEWVVAPPIVSAK